MCPEWALMTVRYGQRHFQLSVHIDIFVGHEIIAQPGSSYNLKGGDNTHRRGRIGCLLDLDISLI